MLLALLTTNIIEFIHIKIYMCIVHHLPLAYMMAKREEEAKILMLRIFSMTTNKLKAYSLFSLSITASKGN